MSKVDMWLDDERPAPEGWVHVKTTWEAIALIKAGKVRRASLDHDLGLCTPCERREVERKDLSDSTNRARNCTCMTGYKLCLWMADTGKWPDEKPIVHSANPPGAFAMKAIIDRYWFGAPKPPKPDPWDAHNAAIGDICNIAVRNAIATARAKTVAETVQFLRDQANGLSADGHNDGAMWFDRAVREIERWSASTERQSDGEVDS